LVYRDFGRALVEADVNTVEKLRCLRSWLALVGSRDTLRKVFLPGRYNVFGIELRRRSKDAEVTSGPGGRRRH
jgi:hypothetical protein